MTTIRVGCGQITWRGVPEEQVLEEIARAGYEGAPAGPSGDRSPEETIRIFSSYGLVPAPGYFSADFWKAGERDRIVQSARRFAAFTRELGCSEMYVAAGGFDRVTRSGRTRSQLAGHVSPEDSLSDEEYRVFADTLSDVGRVTLGEGVRSCFHNHVGSVIETGEEIERLLSLADEEAVFLGPDTGHLAWAGVEVVPFVRKHARRIRTIHLKDVSERVRERGCAEGWDYAAFNRNGIFAELGEGDVDFPSVFRALEDAAFSGWAIVETDVTQKPTAFESAVISREYLRSLGY